MKTLKDLEKVWDEGLPEFHDHAKDLRQGAIDDIKELEEQIKYSNVREEIINAKIQYIKEKFNIKDETDRNTSKSFKAIR